MPGLVLSWLMMAPAVQAEPPPAIESAKSIRQRLIGDWALRTAPDLTGWMPTDLVAVFEQNHLTVTRSTITFQAPFPIGTHTVDYSIIPIGTAFEVETRKEDPVTGFINTSRYRCRFAEQGAALQVVDLSDDAMYTYVLQAAP